MKKVISLFAAITMLSTVAIQASALENYLPTEDKYSVGYEGLTPGAYYGMVAVEGTGADVNTTDSSKFVYIDQATANSAGKIEFNGFAPKGKGASEEGYVESTVFIGGEGLNGAQAIGILRVDGYKAEIVISGSVVDEFATSKFAKIIVQDEQGNVIKQANADAAGVYAVSLDPATSYTVVLTKDGFLKFTITGVPAEEDIALDAVTITNLSGDVSGNNQVMFEDLEAVLNNYTLDAKAATDANADISGNGQIMFEDLEVVLNHYTNAGITEAYVAPAE